VTLTLDILVPDSSIVQTEAASVRAVDGTGEFGLLPGHEDFCAALVPSILIYRDTQGEERYVAVDGGVLVLEDDRVSVVTREAVPSPDMESVADAVASMLAARRQQEREASKAFNTLVAELLERLPQLEVRR
jgi:F-type H+-transporting ATPase subunit epsilon